MKHPVPNIAAFIAILILPGCSMLTEDCTKHSTDPSAYRKCIASQGNTRAQYEVGLVAYYHGDYQTALKWLKLAAAPKSGRTAIYMPPVAEQKYGTVMMMNTGQASKGHAGAQTLLAEIYQKGLGVEVNYETARRYLEMAGKNASHR